MLAHSLDVEAYLASLPEQLPALTTHTRSSPGAGASPSCCRRCSSSSASSSA
nr:MULTISPECIES: hypothetical protein [Amycolatopsis]